MARTLNTSLRSSKSHSPMRIVFSRRVWDNAWRSLLASPALWAVGQLRWIRQEKLIELLVDRLEIVPQPPSGKTRPPLADWVVLRLVDEPGGMSAASLDNLWRQLRPQPYQSLALIALDNSDRSRCSGQIRRQRRCWPLDEIRVVGSRPLRLLPTTAADSSPPLEDPQRWSRTEGAVGSATLRTLQEATVTIVGAGRNGSALAFQLASLPIARLRIIDHDKLGIENLDAMPGLWRSDVGRTKVQALAERLQQFRPDLGITLLDKPAHLAESHKLLRRRSELIMTCVDHDTPRLAASLIASETLTPHLDVGTSVQRREDGSLAITGDVRLLLPREGCCACVGGYHDFDETRYDLNTPPGALRRRPPPAWNAQRAGSLISINAMTVGAAVQIWLDLLAGRITTSFWQRLAWTPDQGLVANAGPVDAAEDCRFCAHPEL